MLQLKIVFRFKFFNLGWVSISQICLLSQVIHELGLEDKVFVYLGNNKEVNIHCKSGFIQKMETINFFKDFSRTTLDFQGPIEIYFHRLYKNAHSQSILIRL